MMEQTKLSLWETLHSTRMMPEQADFEGLLAEVVEAIAQRTESDLWTGKIVGIFG